MIKLNTRITLKVKTGFYNAKYGYKLNILPLPKVKGNRLMIFARYFSDKKILIPKLSDFYSICTNLLRIKALQKSSIYPRVCLRFVQIFLHQDLSTYLRNKSLNLGLM